MDALDLTDSTHVEVDRRFRDEIAIWLTTVSPQGQPRSTPVWFYWNGETFLFYSQPGRPKLANIAANPKVSLHLVGAADAEDAVTIEGTAAIDPSALPGDQIPEYIDRYLGLIERFGWTPASFAADYSVAVRVTPTRFRIL